MGKMRTQKKPPGLRKARRLDRLVHGTASELPVPHVEKSARDSEHVGNDVRLQRGACVLGDDLVCAVDELSGIRRGLRSA